MSAGMAQNISSLRSALTSVTISSLKFQSPNTNVVKDLKEMEMSVNPHLGKNIDMKL